MPLASFSERRNRLRAILARPQTVNPATVFDGSSARLGQAAGAEIGLMGGSLVSMAVLSAPDIMLTSLTEMVEQARRVTRACDLPLLVDADHGYGNALNVARTVQDLEAAGAASLSIEDTELPRRFGEEEGVISREEFLGKLRAAVGARSDPSLLIVGRIEAMPTLGFDEVLERARLCNEAGVDLIFARGLKTLEQVRALHAVTDLPLQIQAIDAPDDELVANNVRIVGYGHVAYMAMLGALYAAQKHMQEGGKVADVPVLSKELQQLVLGADAYEAMAKEFLG